MSKGIFQDEIKVSTDELLAQTELVRNNVNNMRNSFQEISSIIKKTKSHWIGDAGDAYRKCYAENEESIHEMLERLRMQTDGLEQIASNYEQVERQNNQFIGNLPDNLLE